MILKIPDYAELAAKLRRRTRFKVLDLFFFKGLLFILRSLLGRFYIFAEKLDPSVIWTLFFYLFFFRNL